MPSNDRTRAMVDRMLHVVKPIDPRSVLREGVLDLLVEGATDVFPEFDHAGLSVTYRDGRVETTAASSEIPRQLDKVQDALHEGPNHDAFIDEAVVLIQNARHEDRWPRYIDAAAALGLRAQVTSRLYVTNHSIANLNLYSTDSETVGDDTLAMVEVYASHVTAILGRTHTQDELASAMLTRQLIGQATGILMERLQLGPEDAFAYLLRISSTTNTKVRDLARRLVDGEPVGAA